MAFFRVSVFGRGLNGFIYIRDINFQLGVFLKFKKLLEKVPLTAFINTLLRIAYMVLSLITIKSTFNVYFDPSP